MEIRRKGYRIVEEKDRHLWHPNPTVVGWEVEEVNIYYVYETRKILGWKPVLELSSQCFLIPRRFASLKEAEWYVEKQIARERKEREEAGNLGKFRKVVGTYWV